VLAIDIYGGIKWRAASASTIVMRAPVPAKLWLVSAAIGCTIAIAACGSSSPSSTGTAGSSTIARLDKYAACMRDHRVSGFPDPSTTETPNSFGIDGYNFDLPSTMNTQSPAYQSADKTCQRVLGGGTISGAPHLDVAKARKHALAHAQCMREHGVPNFPDPTITVNGHGISQASGGAGINPRSPAFQQAQQNSGYTPGPYASWIAGLHSSHRSECPSLPCRT
jgi:hypothetical protein